MIQKQPVAVLGAVVVLVNSIIALLVLLDVFDETVGAAVSLIATNAVAVVGSIIVRADVTPSVNLPVAVDPG